MTKAPYKTEVLHEAPCPNCNATARLVIERPKKTSQFWEVLLRCDKCKGAWPAVSDDGSGPLMHDMHKRQMDAHRELMKKYEEAKTPAERGKIMAEVRKLAGKEASWLQSL